MVYYMLTERPSDLMDVDFPFFPSAGLPSLLDTFEVPWRPTLHGHRKVSPSTGTMQVTYNDASKEYCVSAPTPGIKREDLKIEVVGGNRVEVTIDHKEGGPVAGGENEAHFSLVKKGFMSVTLPKDADTNKARIEYSDGLLRIYMPSSTPEESEQRLRLAESAYADLNKDYKEKMDKVALLREQLETETRAAEEAREKLREARYQEALRISKERKALTL